MDSAAASAVASASRTRRPRGRSPQQTGGTYHDAKDADQLREVFGDLPKEVATQRQLTEITWWFAALGALLAAAAVAASMRWSPYP